MDNPIGIKQAVLAIWATLALSACSALINKWMGVISMDEFSFAIIIYAIMCIIPYKIARRSNAARYVYIILTIITFLFMFGGMGSDLPKLDFVLSIILIPVEIFILYRLLQKEASDWFSIQKV